MLLAAGFETASQLSALILAGQNNAFLVGAAFSSGMLLVDGLDGYLAASTLRLAAFGEARAKSASRVLTVIVVIFAFTLGGAELIGVELAGIALPLGLALFIVVLGTRVWARSNHAPLGRWTGRDQVNEKRPRRPSVQKLRTADSLNPLGGTFKRLRER
jgi:high-affinity nickel-transport protein